MTRITIAFGVWVATAVAAMADGPVRGIPARPNVPVVIDGADVPFSEDRWRLVVPPSTGHYFPRTGRRPGYGRYEVDTPPQRLPQAESFQRSWGAESPRGFEPIPAQPPSITYAPDYRGWRDRPPR